MEKHRYISCCPLHRPITTSVARLAVQLTRQVHSKIAQFVMFQIYRSVLGTVFINISIYGSLSWTLKMKLSILEFNVNILPVAFTLCQYAQDTRVERIQDEKPLCFLCDTKAYMTFIFRSIPCQFINISSFNISPFFDQ